MGIGRRVQWLGLIVILACLSRPRVDVCAEEGRSALVDVNLFASAVPSEERSIMVGDRGKVFLSEDGAKTWRAIESGTQNALATVCFPDDRNGWAAGQGGVIVHSEDGGRHWEPQRSGSSAYLLDIDFVDPRHGLAVGADSTVLVTDNGGETWTNGSLDLSLDLEEEINLFAVAVMEPNRACVAGDGGRIFCTDDGGRRWAASRSPLYDKELGEGRALYSMTYDSGILYAVGLDGVFVTSRDRGRNWMERRTGFAGPELYCTDFVHGVGLAAGSGGHIIRTSDGGATWHLVDVPEVISRCWLSGLSLQETAAGDIRGLVVGQDGTFGRLESGALRW